MHPTTTRSPQIYRGCHQISPEKKLSTFLTAAAIKLAKVFPPLYTRDPMISPVIFNLNSDETVAIKAIDMKGVKDSISR